MIGKNKLRCAYALLFISCTRAITVDPWAEKALSDCYAVIAKNDFKAVDNNVLGRVVYGGMIKPVGTILGANLPRATTIDDVKVYSCMLSWHKEYLIPKVFMEAETTYEYQGRLVTVNSYALPMYYPTSLGHDITSQGLACWYKKSANGTDIMADASAIQCGSISIPSKIQTRSNIYRGSVLPVREPIDMYVNNSYTHKNNESLVESLAYSALDALAMTTINKVEYTLIRSTSLGATLGYTDLAQGALCDGCKNLRVSHVKIRVVGNISDTPLCSKQASVLPMLYTYGRGANRMHCIGSVYGHSIYYMDGIIASLLSNYFSKPCNPTHDTIILMVAYYDIRYMGFRFVTLNHNDPARYLLVEHNIAGYTGSELKAVRSLPVTLVIDTVMERFYEWNYTTSRITEWGNLTASWTVRREKYNVLSPPIVTNDVDMGISCRDQNTDRGNLDFGPNWEGLASACWHNNYELPSLNEAPRLIDELASNMTQVNSRSKVLSALNSAVAPVLAIENSATWSTIVALIAGSIGSVAIARNLWMPWYLHLLLQCTAIWIPIGTGLLTVSNLLGIVVEFTVWDHVWGSGVQSDNTVSAILINVVKVCSATNDKELKLAVMLTYAAAAQITVIVVAYKSAKKHDSDMQRLT